MMVEGFRSKRKQDKIESDERREVVVKVRFNPAELAVLDASRGRYSRAETLRYLLVNKMPSPVPELNREAWQALSRSASNLNQIASHLNGGGALDLPEIRAALDQFRNQLLGAK